jgi:signal peptidase II
LKKITAIALAVLFLDQIIKFIAVKNIFFTIDIYKNYNALFGLPIDFNFILILFIFILIYYFVLLKEVELLMGSSISLSLGLIFGGAIGNLTDRFFYGYIIDYINLLNLFVFNIADMAICFGALLLSWKILWK